MRPAKAFVTLWAWLLVAGSGIAMAAAAPPAAESRGRVTAVSAAVLNLYQTADAERPDETIGREQVPLPLEVYEIAPNKRLKVKLGSRWLWIDRGMVRTKGVQTEPTCGLDASASSTPSVLAPRGLGKGCR